VPFAALIARLLDRFDGLTTRTAGEPPGGAVPPGLRARLEARAAQVPLLADETRWRQVHDYSARSGREIYLDGKVGRLTYGPEARPFLPLLAAGEIVHLGKNPASGCGRLAVGTA
jgi:hypothetical protein